MSPSRILPLTLFGGEVGGVGGVGVGGNVGGGGGCVIRHTQLL